MPFPSQQARCWIEPDPSRPGQVNFAPRMQVGEVAFGTRRPVQRLLVRDELNQVTGRKARGEPKLTKDLHQQPSGVPTRAARMLQCLFRSLNAGLHSQEVSNVALELLVEAHQKIDCICARLNR